MRADNDHLEEALRYVDQGPAQTRVAIALQRRDDRIAEQAHQIALLVRQKTILEQKLEKAYGELGMGGTVA